MTTTRLCFRKIEDHEVADIRTLPVGAHLVTPRRAYTHHGIYVGGGRVVHYSGSSRSLHIGPVEEVSIELFSRGRPVKVRPHRGSAFSAAEIAFRARSRLGENRYDVFKNNCEHFCEWCIRGANTSYQIDRWLELPRQFAAAFGALR
jgi:hypothetical protein